MTQQDIEKLKDICAKEGFDLIKQDGRYYIEQARNRVLWKEIYHADGLGYTLFRFQLSKSDQIKYLKEEIEEFLSQQLEKYLNNDLPSRVVTYPENVTSTR